MIILINNTDKHKKQAQLYIQDVCFILRSISGVRKQEHSAQFCENYCHHSQHVMNKQVNKQNAYSCIATGITLAMVY